MRRTPLRARPREPNAWASVEAREQRLADRAARAIQSAAAEKFRASTAEAAIETIAMPKPVALRNPRLLAMARGQPCLLRAPGVCAGGTGTTVACHSNLLAHGKSKGRKADDPYTVWGCAACHAWLDQGPAPRAAKAAAFMAAHLRQVEQWRRIATEHTADGAAARWALEHLNATPVPAGEPL